MTSEAKFWLGFNICFWSFMIASVWAIAWHDYHDRILEQEYKVAIIKALENGIDPLEMTCAIEDGAGDNPTCIIHAVKQ